MDHFLGTRWVPADTLDYLAQLAATMPDAGHGFTGRTHGSQCLWGSDISLCKECMARFVVVHLAGRPLSRLSDVGYHV
jgi:hypothetical protein